MADEESEEKVDKRIGNEFWKQRSSHGRNPIFSSHKDLWKSCCEYFQWVSDNPLYETKLVKFKDYSALKEVPKMRAMTIIGLCIFLDICQNTWDNYKKDKDFLRVITKAKNIIRTQKFEGASADMLNANIIARDLGLRDKQDVTISNPEDRQFNLNFTSKPSVTGDNS